jgi:Tol biopolymer transport system component
MDKDPKRRLRDIGDARLALEGAFGGAGAEMVSAASPPSGRLAWTAFAVALLAAAGLAIPAVLYFRSGPVDVPERRLDIVTPGTDQLSFALSPDGRQFVYGDGQRLWLRPMDKTTAQPLAATEGASNPFWSPDGRSLGFFASGQLKRLDLVGGGAQVLAPVSVLTARGGTWGPDGTILFATASTGPLFRIPATGGKAVAVTTLDKQTGHRFPQFLPGGRQFLFYALGTPDTTGIYLGSLDGPETTRLTAADSAGVYAPQGWLLFVRAGTLLARRLDLEQRALVGNPVTVADPVGRDSSPGPTVAASVSATGLVAYRTGGTDRRQLTWFDRSGKPLGVVGAPDENDLLAPRLSPDGRRVAAHRTIQGNVDIWLLDADRTMRFTFDAAADKFPVWSPDGGGIVFDSDRRGTRDLYVTPSSSPGSEKLLLESVLNAHDWSLDGRFISYVRIDPQTAGDLWLLPLQGDRKPFVFLQTAFDERRGMFSPDGRWVAYHANPSGSYEVYVRPFPGPGGEQPVSTMGGVYPRWRADGNELYYLAPDGTLMAAPIAVRGATLESGRPVALFRTRIVGGGTNVNVGMNYDIDRDGRFLINTIVEGASASPITLLLNWRPEATQ